jgi:hypothetical protein
VPRLAWAEGVAEADETGIEARTGRYPHRPQAWPCFIPMQLEGGVETRPRQEDDVFHLLRQESSSARP